MDRELGNPDKQIKLFMSLVLSGQKNIYVYILSLVMSPSDSDDILQDTLSIMWEKFNEFEPGTNFVAWGKQIARYRTMEYFRKNKSSRLCYEPDVMNIIESKVGGQDDLTEHKDALKKCLEKLPEKSLSLIKMRHGQDMSYSQIALKYGISKQSLYRSISRIHATLLKCIKTSLAIEESYEV